MNFILSLMMVTVQKIHPNGTVTIIGQEGYQNGEFRFLTSITIDSNDILYVADTFNNRIQKIHPNGTVTIINDKIKFINPTGIVIDDNGILYIVDKNNNRIQKIHPNGTGTTIMTNH